MLQPTAGMWTEYLGHRSATHHDASEVPARCRLSGNLQAKFRIITVVVTFVWLLFPTPQHLDYWMQQHQIICGYLWVIANRIKEAFTVCVWGGRSCVPVRQELGRERERKRKKLFRHTIQQQFVCQVLTKSNHFRVWGVLFSFILLQSRLRCVIHPCCPPGHSCANAREAPSSACQMQFFKFQAKKAHQIICPSTVSSLWLITLIPMVDDICDCDLFEEGHGWHVPFLSFPQVWRCYAIQLLCHWAPFMKSQVKSSVWFHKMLSMLDRLMQFVCQIHPFCFQPQIHTGRSIRHTTQYNLNIHYVTITSGKARKTMNR